MSIPNLETTLKQLRLSGLAATVNLRLQEAAANRLSHGQVSVLTIDSFSVGKLPVLTPAPRRQRPTRRLKADIRHPQPPAIRGSLAELVITDAGPKTGQS